MHSSRVADFDDIVGLAKLDDVGMRRGSVCEADAQVGNEVELSA
jgi:hypothetical protein